MTVLGAVVNEISAQASFDSGRDAFLDVNGVRLHYVDWGGNGEAVIFLTGLGDIAHTFDAFAATLVDRFHVVGLTRRGQAQSERPPSGYDTQTLVADLNSALDRLNIARANLVGHSLAGDEMTLFAGLHPDRVIRLVYLDAAYDRARGYELIQRAGLPDPRFPTESATALERASRAFHPDYTRVRAPALGFFVIYDSAPVTPDMDAATRRRIETYYVDYGKAYTDEQIALFRNNLRGAQVIELHDADHYVFRDPKFQSRVFQETRAFLLRRP